MKAFEFQKAKSERSIFDAIANPSEQVRLLAGGTTLVDLMKLHVEAPDVVLDINRLPLAKIEIDHHTGELVIGALVRNSDLADHPIVREHYQVLSEALLSGASPQLRNVATTGGNLLQRTRCPYFRDVAFPCNKRLPGSGCPAQNGMNRTMAIFGTSSDCIAVNPSDMNVALLALGAKIHIHGAKSSRIEPIDGFHLLPGHTPNIETKLKSNEIITAVSLPKFEQGTKSSYLKIRDRAAYEFALTSIALVGRLESGRMERISIALGGVGTVPWRAVYAEKVLLHNEPSLALFHQAIEAELIHAHPLSDNKFKIELVRRGMSHSLALVMLSHYRVIS